MIADLVRREVGIGLGRQVLEIAGFRVRTPLRSEALRLPGEQYNAQPLRAEGYAANP